MIASPCLRGFSMQNLPRFSNLFCFALALLVYLEASASNYWSKAFLLSGSVSSTFILPRPASIFTAFIPSSIFFVETSIGESSGL
jgi:hypothetical protein